MSKVREEKSGVKLFVLSPYIPAESSIGFSEIVKGRGGRNSERESEGKLLALCDALFTLLSFRGSTRELVSNLLVPSVTGTGTGT